MAASCFALTHAGRTQSGLRAAFAGLAGASNETGNPLATIQNLINVESVIDRTYLTIQKYKDHLSFYSRHLLEWKGGVTFN